MIFCFNPFVFSFLQHNSSVHEVFDPMGHRHGCRLHVYVPLWVLVAILAAPSLRARFLQVQGTGKWKGGVHEDGQSDCNTVQFHLQAFSVLFVCIAITSDLVCLFFIPVHWLLFAASTYVWVQYVWHTGASSVVAVGRFYGHPLLTLLSVFLQIRVSVCRP